MITETTIDVGPTPEAYKVLRNARRWKKVSVKQARIAYRVMCRRNNKFVRDSLLNRIVKL